MDLVPSPPQASLFHESDTTPRMAKHLEKSLSPNLAAVMARFQALAEKAESPVRAIQHQPAREGIFAPVPDSIQPALRDVLKQRGIERQKSLCQQACQHSRQYIAASRSGERLVAGGILIQVISVCN